MSTIQVKIIRIGQPSVEVTINNGQTANDALVAGGVESTGTELRFNGVVVPSTAILNTNGDLMVTKPIAGASR